jgi:glutamate-1-semialdehyde 2,1-aminomutase
LKVAHFSTVWSLIFTQPSRYNWMLQFYLRAEGLALSWVGTGRLIFRIDLPDDAFADISRRIVAAAEAMHRDGWWWSAPGLTNQTIRRRVRSETLRAWRISRASGRAALPVTGTEAPSSTS